MSKLMSKPTSKPLKALLFSLCFALAATALAQAQPAPECFEHAFAEVNGVNYHYVSGGEGPAVVLLHGWPETWYVWRNVMPQLAEAGYTVVAPDLRGMGETEIAEGGYDARTVASDIRALTEELGIARHYLAAHDIGVWSAYAYTNEYPDAVEAFVVLDVVLMDERFDEFSRPSAEGNFWHFAFFDAEGLPEFLLGDRFGAYMAGGFDASEFTPGAISQEERQVYVDLYSQPERLSASFEHYRAVEANVARTAEYKAAGFLPMPVLTLGAAPGTGASGIIVEQMRAASEDFEGRVLESCGHFIPTECPDLLADEMLSFFQR